MSTIGWEGPSGQIHSSLSPRPVSEYMHIVESVEMTNDMLDLFTQDDQELLCYFLGPLLDSKSPTNETSFCSFRSISINEFDESTSTSEHLKVDAAFTEHAPSTPIQGDSETAHLWGRQLNCTPLSDDDDSASQKEKEVDLLAHDEVDLTRYQSEQWSMRFKELRKFRERYGHCVVPYKWPQNPVLATWVKRQRYQFKLREQGKRSTLTQERKDALDDLCFVWNSYDAAWEEKFNDLVAYKRQYGHTNVSSTDKNHSLSVWVQCQRRRRKLKGGNSQMKKERVVRLNEIGFVWNHRRAGRS